MPFRHSQKLCRTLSGVVPVILLAVTALAGCALGVKEMNVNHDNMPAMRAINDARQKGAQGTIITMSGGRTGSYTVSVAVVPDDKLYQAECGVFPVVCPKRQAYVVVASTLPLRPGAAIYDEYLYVPQSVWAQQAVSTVILAVLTEGKWAKVYPCPKCQYADTDQQGHVRLIKQLFPQMIPVLDENSAARGQSPALSNSDIAIPPFRIFELTENGAVQVPL